MKENLLPFLSEEKEPSAAFGQKEQMIGGLTLIHDHRMSEIAPLRSGPQDGAEVRRSQTFQKS